MPFPLRNEFEMSKEGGWPSVKIFYASEASVNKQLSTWMK
jgi:hypothetical protein